MTNGYGADSRSRVEMYKNGVTIFRRSSGGFQFAFLLLLILKYISICNKPCTRVCFICTLKHLQKPEIPFVEASFNQVISN